MSAGSIDSDLAGPNAQIQITCQGMGCVVGSKRNATPCYLVSSLWSLATCLCMHRAKKEKKNNNSDQKLVLDELEFIQW